MNRKLAILERMFATDVILEVWNHPGSLKPNLAGMTPGYEKTKMTRVMEMLDAGIMTCERTQDGSVGLYLTDMGGFLAVRLMEINDRLVDGNPWATTETKPIEEYGEKKDEGMSEIEDIMRGILTEEHLLANQPCRFIACDFDPDAHFTPMEVKHRKLASALGLDYDKLQEEALEEAREYLRSILEDEEEEEEDDSYLIPDEFLGGGDE